MPVRIRPPFPATSRRPTRSPFGRRVIGSDVPGHLAGAGGDPWTVIALQSRVYGEEWNRVTVGRGYVDGLSERIS